MRTGSHLINKAMILICAISLLPAFNLGCAGHFLHNDSDQPNITPPSHLSLHYFVTKGDTKKLKQLIANGANVNETDSSGFTPLHLSAIKGHLPISKILLDNNAKLNPKDPEGLTPLSWAALEGQKDVVEMLIKRGSDINTKDNNGQTPLEKAHQRGYPEVAKILIAHGAKTDKEEKFASAPPSQEDNFGLESNEPSKELETNAEIDLNSSDNLPPNENGLDSAQYRDLENVDPPTPLGHFDNAEHGQPPEKKITPPPLPKLSRSKRFQKIILLLGNGDARQAKIDLEAYLKDFQDSDKASLLLLQINNNPFDLFEAGNKHFEYMVQPNETLSTIAKRFLGDLYLFYALARYNGIDSPNKVKVGQIIKIPGQNSYSPEEAMVETELPQKLKFGAGKALKKNNSPQCPQIRNTPLAPPEIYNLENPLKDSPENLAAAKKVYLETAMPLKCVLCHGSNGSGVGDPNFWSTPPARNFTCSETMNQLPDGQLFWIIKTGAPDTAMPVFSDLGDKVIWQLVLYIRQFAK
jgi:nucleoid-associated protein YgaU/mono/diheme cytochrome c family protein